MSRTELEVLVCQQKHTIEPSLFHGAVSSKCTDFQSRGETVRFGPLVSQVHSVIFTNIPARVRGHTGGLNPCGSMHV